MQLTERSENILTNVLARNSVSTTDKGKCMDVKVPDDDSSEGWMIDDEAQASTAEQAPGASPVPWRVLIVDDDVDVHVVTKFSLSNACFMGRRLSFLHAYSGEEALTTLRNNPDVALVLLDVIMETSDAGLRVANQIRPSLPSAVEGFDSALQSDVLNPSCSVKSREPRRFSRPLIIASRDAIETRSTPRLPASHRSDPA